jgi:hypothetical protein
MSSVGCTSGKRGDRSAEVPGEEQDRAVGLEPGQFLVLARVGVQRLLLRGEGVEERETGLAWDVLVVPLEVELDRDGDLLRLLGQDSTMPFDDDSAVNSERT